MPLKMNEPSACPHKDALAAETRLWLGSRRTSCPRARYSCLPASAPAERIQSGRPQVSTLASRDGRDHASGRTAPDDHEVELGIRDTYFFIIGNYPGILRIYACQRAGARREAGAAVAMRSETWGDRDGRRHVPARCGRLRACFACSGRPTSCWLARCGRARGAHAPGEAGAWAATVRPPSTSGRRQAA
jgi:hypothetical protein